MSRALKARRQRPMRPLTIRYGELREGVTQRRRLARKHGRTARLQRALGSVAWALIEPAVSIAAPVFVAIRWVARCVRPALDFVVRAWCGVPPVR